MTFILTDTPLEGLKLIKRNKIEDNRGYLSRFFCIDDLNSSKDRFNISQINYTSTFKKGTVRGMHFQIGSFAEKKIVNCLQGEIYDVAVDLRPDSKTFLHWYSQVLSKENLYSLYIPKGFAHGFQALTDNVDLLYFHSAPYSKEYERGINVHDPKINIKWPLEITSISNRDSMLEKFNEDILK